ncbi:unnamed protein product [Schistosoma spindalis]|nr:unnamed protein product [Schistosoma spindale]
MCSPLYDVLESYESGKFKKGSVRASKWMGYRNESMTFDEIMEQVEVAFAEKFGSKDCNKYPTVVEIRPSGGPACESLFTVLRHMTDDQISMKACGKSADIFQSDWSNFSVYIKRFHLNSIKQDEFMDETKDFIEQLSEGNFNYMPEPYYWIIYDPSLKTGEDGNAEIWLKIE